MRRLIFYLTAPLWFPGLLVLALVAGLFGPDEDDYLNKYRGWNEVP